MIDRDSYFVKKKNSLQRTMKFLEAKNVSLHNLYILYQSDIYAYIYKSRYCTSVLLGQEYCIVILNLLGETLRNQILNLFFQIHLPFHTLLVMFYFRMKCLDPSIYLAELQQHFFNKPF